MKKLTFMAAMAIAAATFVSCGSNTPKANLKTDIDSLSYALGVTQSPIVENIFMQQDIDSAYIAAFIKGLNDGVNAGDNKKKAAYYTGIQLGQQLANQGVRYFNYQVFGEDSTQTISLQNLLAGFVSGINNKEGKGALMSMDRARVISDSLTNTVRAKSMEKTYGENKKAGEDFLAENAKKEGVTVVPVTIDQPDGTKLNSFIQYKVIKEGTGKIPADTTKVKVNYEGRLIDGTVFDSSYQRNQPFETMVKGRIIPGWTEALRRMPVGSTWEVYIPQELAYRDGNQGVIKPFSTLIFKMELLEAK